MPKIITRDEIHKKKLREWRVKRLVSRPVSEEKSTYESKQAMREKSKGVSRNRESTFELANFKNLYKYFSKKNKDDQDKREDQFQEIAIYQNTPKFNLNGVNLIMLADMGADRSWLTKRTTKRLGWEKQVTPWRINLKTFNVSVMPTEESLNARVA